MRINDYAALHGQFASNDPRMYLSPEDSGSRERLDDNKIGSETNYKFGTNQSVRSSVDLENKSHVTATSFGAH